MLKLCGITNYTNAERELDIYLSPVIIRQMAFAVQK